jgi:predicted GNAT family acetyltransferase
MIRKLTDADRDPAIALLQCDPEINLYMLGNMEAIGFDAAFCDFWGDFDDEGALRGIANRYFTGWVVYGETMADWSGLAGLIDTDASATRLQDNPVGIPSILPLLKRHRAADVQIEELMRLAPADFVPQSIPAGLDVRRATIGDKDDLVTFYRDAGNMHRSEAGVERPLRDTRVYLGLRAGKIVCTALTNAEIADRAMIGGVYTLPEERGKGTARAVVSALCADLIASGKTPALYWVNPSAGMVYRTLGFTPVGTWRAVVLGG